MEGDHDWACENLKPLATSTPNLTLQRFQFHASVGLPCAKTKAVTALRLLAATVSTQSPRLAVGMLPS